MLKVYHSFKLALLVFLLSIILGILIYENTKEFNFDYNQNTFVKEWINSYKSLKTNLLEDPYNKNTIRKIENSKEDFKKIFYNLFSAVSNLATDKSFYNDIFIYMVSKNMDGMENLTKSRFAVIPSFKDLILIDKNKNVLYKYGNNSFVTEYFNITNDIELRFLGDDLGILKKFNDPTTDYDIEIIALFDHEAITKQLKNIDYPAFFIMNKEIYKNSAPLPVILNNIQKDLNNERKYYVGLKVVDTMVLMRDNFYIGTFGITYPSRSLGSTLLILLKIIIFLLIFVILIAIDSFLEKKCRKFDEWKKDIPSSGIRKFNIDKEELKDSEANLEWIKTYIQDAESKK